MKYIIYKGKGEHSINELEKIIEQREFELHLFKTKEYYANEMHNKLNEIIVILDSKCTEGCTEKTWKNFQNGNGEDVGLEIDKFISETKQLLKEFKII